MPAIKNLNFIADMGRMNGALPQPEMVGCFAIPSAVPRPAPWAPDPRATRPRHRDVDIREVNGDRHRLAQSGTKKAG